MNDVDESKFQVVDVNSAHKTPSKKINLPKQVKEEQPKNELISTVETMKEIDEAVFELPHDKNVDVFNALSLYNEELGLLYESEGYNPLGEDFVLTEDFAKSVLENKGNENCDIADFLEQNNIQVSKRFTSALEKNEKLINKFNKEISNQNDPKTKEEMKKMIISLKNRSQLLKLNIQKLKNKDANAIKMYKELFGQDSELSKLLKEEFEDKLNVEMIIQKMIGLSITRVRNAKTKFNKTNVSNKDMLTEIKNEVQKDISAQNNNIANQNAEQQQRQEMQEKQEETKIQQEQQEKDQQNNNQTKNQTDLSY